MHTSSASAAHILRLPHPPLRGPHLPWLAMGSPREKGFRSLCRRQSIAYVSQPPPGKVSASINSTFSGIENPAALNNSFASAAS